MSPFRRTLLGLYRGATSAPRWRAVRRWRQDGGAPVSVLFYHRVADTTPNDWTMPTATFRRQLDWLERRFDIVSLAEAQRRLLDPRPGRPAVAITFDDGYADNCEFAIPLLIQRRAPFTYFVSTRYVRDQSPFPHDVEAGAPLRPNTIGQLRAMADAGVEIGAHTRNHIDLGDPSLAGRYADEIHGSIDDLSDWLGRRPTRFAFPYGLPTNISLQAMAVAREAGLEAVCSAYGAYNLPEAVGDPWGAFHLRRIHADPDWERFSNWMTFDPRKLRRADPIDDDLWAERIDPPPAAAIAAGADVA